MALASTIEWELRPTASANMANGGGFKPGASGTDYSQQDSAQYALTGGTTAGANAILLHASAANDMVGNVGHLISGTNATVGWFEVISVVVGVSITFDRNITTGIGSNIVMNIGGALGLNSTLDDDFFEVPVTDNVVHVKTGAYVLGEAVSISSANFVKFIGYYSVRGDSPTQAQKPVIAGGANAFAMNGNKYIKNIIVTGTAATTASCTTSIILNSKFTNTSTTANRNAFDPTAYSFIKNCEFVSQNGEAVEPSGSYHRFADCYFHDSLYGFLSTNESLNVFTDCIFHANRTMNASNVGTTNLHQFSNCTFYGRSAKIGIGNNFSATATSVKCFRNIYSGLTTAINRDTSASASNFQEKNNFYNNTTDLTNFASVTDTTTLDPQFEGVSEISGTTATSAGSVLTQSGGDFSTVVDNESYLHIISGTGLTANRGYLITSHTADSVTVNNSLGTSSAGDAIYFITTGRDFKIGTNLRAGATIALNSETTSYLDIGAVQREEPEPTSGGSSTSLNSSSQTSGYN